MARARGDCFCASYVYVCMYVCACLSAILVCMYVRMYVCACLSAILMCVCILAPGVKQTRRTLHTYIHTLRYHLLASTAVHTSLGFRV